MAERIYDYGRETYDAADYHYSPLPDYDPTDGPDVPAATWQGWSERGTDPADACPDCQGTGWECIINGDQSRDVRCSACDGRRTRTRGERALAAARVILR